MAKIIKEANTLFDRFELQIGIWAEKLF